MKKKKQKGGKKEKNSLDLSLNSKPCTLEKKK